MIHAVEFRSPKTCEACDADDTPRTAEEEATGDLPFIPGMPTPIEDERQFRDLSKMFLEASKASEVATVAVKYAELGLRALTTAAAAADKRVSSWVTEKRQAELRALHGARAKRK